MKTEVAATVIVEECGVVARFFEPGLTREMVCLRHGDPKLGRRSPRGEAMLLPGQASFFGVVACEATPKFPRGEV